MKASPDNARAVVHEMRNQLAVAVANLEGWHDGKLEPTPKRIAAVLRALAALDALIDDLYDIVKESGARSPGTHGEPQPIDVRSATPSDTVMSDGDARG